MEKNDDNLILLGSSTKPHGIKGGFVLNLENTVDSVLNKGVKFLALPLRGSSIDEEGREITIKSISFGNKVIAYLDDITDRNITESMLPFEIYVSRDIFPESDEDEVYLADIVGMDVFDISKGEVVGRVTKYFDNGAHIVITAKINGTHVDIPFVERFVEVIDHDNNRLECNIPRLI